MQGRMGNYKQIVVAQVKIPVKWRKEMKGRYENG